MSDVEEHLGDVEPIKDTNLIDLSENGEMGSSLLDFQVDNAEIYAHADCPIIESTMEEQSHQQLDLIDNFEVSEEDIKFTELPGENEDEQIEIHGGVELPDLPDLAAHQQGTTIGYPNDEHQDQLSNFLPDITDVSEVDVNNDLDYEQAKLFFDSEKASLPTEAQTVKDDSRDQQIRILREIIQSVGDLLSDQIPNSTFIIPESFDEASASDLVSQFSTLIAQIGTKKITAAPETATVTKADQPTKLELPSWLDEESQQEAVVGNIPEESDWEESNEYQPAPDYGLESPVISHLLNTWTTDTTKIEFLRSWVRSLYMPSYESQNYPPGLQITNLSGVLRDGFMVLLIPLIRSLSKPEVVVHVKRHLASQDRLLSTARSTSTDNDHSPTDPFAKDVLYDIRIKRLDITLSADSGLHSTTVEGYMNDNVAARQYYQSTQGSNKFRVDSQYYSPLSEINSALPAIEEKTKRRIFDHAPKEDLEEMMKPHHTPGPRHKSFDREYPGYSSFSRGVDAVDRGPRSVSFSMPHAPPVPQATILESIYSWWGGAPAATPASVPAPAPATPAVPKEPVAQTPSVNVRSTTPDTRSESPYTSLADVAAAPLKSDSGSSTAQSSARASPAVTPVNKIAERLQKIRDQKQQQV